MANGVGDAFQQETKYHRHKRPAGWQEDIPGTEPFKTYPGQPRFVLPTPLEDGGLPVWQCMKSRRSARDYAPQAVTAEELSQLLWAGQGISRLFRGFGLRTAPSAGALYPVETYVSVHNVESLDPGLYHYHVLGHALELLAAGPMGDRLARAALEQDFLAAAAAVFLWTAVFDRCKWKYKQRAYRYVYLDAGHIAQNVALAAVALGLGTCQVAALYDDEVNTLLNVDGRSESIVYMTSVGRT